jgi:hypothetical protein
MIISDLNEYREYAQECVRWAAEAKDQEDRETLLEMAKAWTRVAISRARCHDAIAADGDQSVEQRLTSRRRWFAGCSGSS